MDVWSGFKDGLQQPKIWKTRLIKKFNFQSTVGDPNTKRAWYMSGQKLFGYLMVWISNVGLFQIWDAKMTQNHTTVGIWIPD